MKITQPKISSRAKKLYISFSLDGKQVRKSTGLSDTKANRALVQNQIIPELLIKVHSGEFFKNSKVPTVDEYRKISFAIHQQHRKEFTIRSYERVYELHIQSVFGDKKLNSIKASELAIWQNNLLEKLAPKTVKLIRSVFCTILDDALKDELISKNPFSIVDSPKNKEVKEKNPFTLDEINQILSHANPKMKAFFALGFFTGMRTGELIALKWSDINFQDKTISISRSIRQGVESVPKTKNSIRTIEILDVLMPYLLAHRKSSDNDAVYVFETYQKKAYTSADKIRVSYWEPLLKELNIKYRILYQMRHTFASMMISNGEDILWVSNMLGHKDSTTTLQSYARYIQHEKKTRASFLLTQN